MADYYVYFLANKTNDVLYVGITNNLERRLYEHKQGTADAFSKKYRTHKLVYFEIFSDPENAIAREKQIKRWRRDKKDHLVKLQNPDWFDLSDQWYGPDPSASGDALRSG
jgi:putative endonuclease